MGERNEFNAQVTSDAAACIGIAVALNRMMPKQIAIMFGRKACHRDVEGHVVRRTR